MTQLSPANCFNEGLKLHDEANPRCPRNVRSKFGSVRHTVFSLLDAASGEVLLLLTSWTCVVLYIRQLISDDSFYCIFVI